MLLTGVTKRRRFVSVRPTGFVLLDPPLYSFIKAARYVNHVTHVFTNSHRPYLERHLSMLMEVKHMLSFKHMLKSFPYRVR